MKKILLIFFVMLLVGTINAATDTPIATDTFQINNVINYAKGCFNNGTYCSNSAVCNYTTFQPSGSIRINNQQATNNFSNHNLTMLFDQIGLWQVDMVCFDGELRGSETFYAEITGSGLNESFEFYIIVLILSFGVIIFGLWKEDAPITILGTFGLYFLGIYILVNGIAGVKDLTTTWAIGIITLGLAMYISAKSAHELIVG